MRHKDGAMLGHGGIRDDFMVHGRPQWFVQRYQAPMLVGQDLEHKSD